MIISQSDVFDVPVTGSLASSYSALVFIREVNDFNRVFLFRNLSTTGLIIQIQENDGSGWTDVGSSITLGIRGSGSEVYGVTVESNHILRIVGKGGASDKELEVCYVRVVVDENGLDDDINVWTSPAV